MKNINFISEFVQHLPFFSFSFVAFHALSPDIFRNISHVILFSRSLFWSLFAVVSYISPLPCSPNWLPISSLAEEKRSTAITCALSAKTRLAIRIVEIVVYKWGAWIVVWWLAYHRYFLSCGARAALRFLSLVPDQVRELGTLSTGASSAQYKRPTLSQGISFQRKPYPW